MAFRKFVSVLQLIADASERQNVSELGKASGLPRPTVYRILNGLTAEGLITESAHDKTFALGPRLIALASRSWETSDLRIVATDELQHLRDDVGETVHLAVPSGTTMVFIDKLESPQAVRMTSRIGTQVQLHSTSVGKSYLASLPEDERSALLGQIELKRLTPHTLTTRKQLEAEIRHTAQRGYAVDREENELEILCVGAAIRDRSGRGVGAISISTPKYRFSERSEARYAKILIEHAQRISDRLISSGGGVER